MIQSFALKRMRRPDPGEPGAGAFLFFGLIAVAGFAFGWAAQQALGVF